jgi:osmoprotectant transport system ATP-binding protein
MIEFRDVSKTYPGTGTSVVNDLSFEILDGEICVLVGPSGCGKTTSMRMVNRLIETTEGEILIDGEPNTSMSGTQLRRKIGYAIQQIGPLPPPHHRRQHRHRPEPARLGEGSDQEPCR